MKSYIVRVYRRVSVDEDSISGILEDIESGQEEPFHSINELQFMLSRSVGVNPIVAKKLIYKCRNTALFFDKTSMEP